MDDSNPKPAEIAKNVSIQETFNTILLLDASDKSEANQLNVIEALESALKVFNTSKYTIYLAIEANLVNLVPRFVEFLSFYNNNKLLFLATEILNEIYCISYQVKYLVNAGAIEVLVRLLPTNCTKTRENAMKILKKISGKN